MIIDSTKEGSKVIWQETKDENMPIAEPALLIDRYDDVLSITQEGRSININYATIPGLCKLLKELSKDKI